MGSLENSKLLIADDQALIREAISHVLKSRDFRFDAVRDGEEAVRLLNTRGDYAAVVLDQRMPGLRGLEVVNHVRCGHSKACYDLPLMLVTGHGEKAVVKAAANLDVDAVLGKPLTTKTFLERLEKILRHPSPRKSMADYAAVRLPSPRAAKRSDNLVSPGVVLQGKPLWITAANIRAAGGAGDGPKKLVPVDTLASGMVLAQALHASNGQLLAGPGLILNKRLIAKIQARAEELKGYGYIEIMEREESSESGRNESRRQKAP